MTTSSTQVIRCTYMRLLIILSLTLLFRRYFLEEDAVDGDGKLTREKEKAVNKIGHGSLLKSVPISSSFSSINIGLHELEPAFRKVTLQNEKLKSIVRDLRFHHDPVGQCVFQNIPLKMRYLYLSSWLDKRCNPWS